MGLLLQCGLNLMDKSSFHVSIKEAFSLLQKEEHLFVKVRENGTMSVKYFAPQKTDTQSPHKPDELI